MHAFLSFSVFVCDAVSAYQQGYEIESGTVKKIKSVLSD